MFFYAVSAHLKAAGRSSFKMQAPGWTVAILPLALSMLASDTGRSAGAQPSIEKEERGSRISSLPLDTSNKDIAWMISGERERKVNLPFMEVAGIEEKIHKIDAPVCIVFYTQNVHFWVLFCSLSPKTGTEELIRSEKKAVKLAHTSFRKQMKCTSAHWWYCAELPKPQSSHKCFFPFVCLLHLYLVTVSPFMHRHSTVRKQWVMYVRRSQRTTRSTVQKKRN